MTGPVDTRPDPVTADSPEKSMQDRSAEIRSLRTEIRGLQAELEEANRELLEVS